MFDKKILLPHQYYYPHMDLFEDKSTVKAEGKLRLCIFAFFLFIRLNW